MKKCMIEVIKTTFDAELAMDYGLTGPCPMHQVGQVFYAVSINERMSACGMMRRKEALRNGKETETAV